MMRNAFVRVLLVTALLAGCNLLEVGTNPPNTPTTPSGPSNGRPGIAIDFSSSATDPDTDNVCIRFSWGDGDTSGWSALVASGASVSQAHAWANVGSYQVSVQAKDANGATSAWSASLQVTITQGGGGTPGTLKWWYMTKGNVWSSPALGSDGVIYVGSTDDSLHAVNPDGTRRWVFGTADDVFASPAVASDGTLYIGSNDFCPYAVGSSGSRLWPYRTGDWVCSSPSIDASGAVCVGSHDKHLHARLVDGSEKWSPVALCTYWWADILSSPAVGADGTVYIGSGNWLYAVNGAVGDVRWAFDTNARVYASPAIGADGTVYIGSTNGKMFAVTTGDTFTVRWSYQTGDDASSAAIGPDGTVYFGSYDDYVYAVSSGGSLLWRYRTGGDVWACPAIGADGTVYAASKDGYLYALNSNGELSWRFQARAAIESSPTIGPDGTVYFGCSDSCLYAVYGSAPLATSAPWPKFHHDMKNTGRVGGGR